MCVLLAAVFAASLHAGEDFQEQTEEQTRASEKAMKWLLKAQNHDGSWGLDANSPGDITCTALAAMALIEAGYTEREGAEASSVNALRRATEYILSAAKKAKGDIELSETTLIQYKLGRRVHNFFGVPVGVLDYKRPTLHNRIARSRIWTGLRATPAGLIIRRIARLGSNLRRRLKSREAI